MSGPNEQFIPIASAPKPSSMAIIAWGQAPVISFPDLSYAFVTNTGRLEHSFAARTAALVSKQSFMVSIIIISAPFITASFTQSEKMPTASSKPKSPIGSISLPVGPISKAIYLSL